MAKITKIAEQKKAKNRVNVYIDDEFAFGISSLLLVDFDIYKGKKISKEEIERFKEADNLSKCLSGAYRFLSFRMRSEKEMRDKLSEKYHPDIVEKALSKLKEYNYINDRDFTKAWAKDRIKNYSLRSISYELKKKGVAKEIIEKIVGEIDQAEELESAYDLISSRRKYQGLDRDQLFQKAGGFLSRRGYSYDLIKKAINKYLENTNL